MSDDIVKRLLDWKTWPTSEDAQLYFDAAQEIERLREENRKLQDDVIRAHLD